MRDLILGLARPIRQRVGRDEGGAIAVLIAVLIGGGVLTGMGALVIDIGQLYVERAQLQNGADAAALAVAKSCAAGTCTASLATTYADANAGDGISAVRLVCGSADLGNCPPSTGRVADCPPPPAGPDYVDVHTATEQANGSTLLPPSFARALPGNGGYNGSTVGACAQAEWGPPQTGTTMALTISACERDQATSQGTVFAPSPPYPPDPAPPPSADQLLTLGASPGSSCSGEPAGADGPGAFGWTDDDTGACSVAITSAAYGDNTQASAGQSCLPALATAVASRAPVELPVYVSASGTGSGAYTLKGFAAFVITGYQLPSGSAPDWLNPANSCPGSAECIDGFFVRALIPATGSIGGPDLGASEIRLSG